MRYIYRLPSTEIESHVDKALQENLRDPAKLSQILTLNPEKDQDILVNIANHKLMQASKAINKVVIDSDQYTIELNVSKLCHHIREATGVQMENVPESAVSRLVVPFRPTSSTRGTVVLEPPGAEGDVEIIFDLPRKKIKDLVRGVAWREDYFRGETIAQIAQRDGVSRPLVSRLIEESFSASY